MPAETVDNPDDQPDPETGVASGEVDDTGAATTEEPTPGAPEAEGLEDDTADLGTLTDEEFEALQQDPEKLRKAVMMARDYTTKTQKVAGLRKFVEAFEADPQGTVRKMATGLGLKFADEPAAPAAAAAAAVEDARAQIAAVLGNEAADALVPVLEGMIDKAVAPLRQTTEQVLGTSALTQAESVMDAFTAEQPEWKKLEPKMVALSRTIQAAPGLSPLVYMRMLHTLALANASKADQLRGLTERVTTSVRGSDSRTTGTPTSRVHETPAKKPSFDEAWNAAVRGKKLVY